MRQAIVAIALLTATLLLASCSRQEDPTPPAPQQGRAETQGIRNTDAIGYSGSAIANKVDGALDANDEQKKKMDQALQNSDKSQPDPQ